MKHNITGLILLLMSSVGWSERAHERGTFEHRSVVEDFYIGMPKADILFRFGEPDKKWENGNIGYDGTSTRPTVALAFIDNKLMAWNTIGHDVDGPRSTEKLLNVAGQPFIEAYSDETNRKRLTYITGNEEGFTYTYEDNELIGVMAGKVGWREIYNFSFYSVKGTQICPGDMCPFVLEQKDTFVTDEWKDKSVWDLINKYDL